MADERFELEKSPAIEITARETSGLRPRYPGYGYGDSYGKEEGKIHLRELWRTVRKRKWLIVTIVFVISVLVTIEMYRTKNTYQATTMIEVGKDNTSVARSGALYIDDYDPFYMVTIKTKMLMIQSRSLLEDVVVEKRLERNPKFLEIGEKKSIWEALKTIGGKFGPSSSDRAENGDELAIVETSLDPEKERELREGCIRMLQTNLSVEPIRETKALRVSYTHTDPKLASEICNAIADAFLKRNFENKVQKFTDTKDFLEDSTTKLKARLQKAEKDLADYTRDHNFFSTDGKENHLDHGPALRHAQPVDARRSGPEDKTESLRRGQEGQRQRPARRVCRSGL